MSLGICIPTYNRFNELKNCLNSIFLAYSRYGKINLEICVSDNSECKKNFETIKFFRKKFKKKVKIRYQKFNKNQGVALNYLKCISMAKSEFVWTIGDDDLITYDSLIIINNLLKKKHIDYFFINSYLLKSDIVKSKKLIDTRKLSKKMERFSKIKKNMEVDFFELIDPKVSYDYLMAIFFSLFRKNKWDQNLKILDKKQLKDKRWLSNFENSCFNQIVLVEAFRFSKAYFQSKPLSVNTSGSRDWRIMYDFLEIVRFPEILNYYRSKGLGFFRYLYCKNYSLRNFSNFFLKIFLHRKKNSGWEYVNFYKHIFVNIFYPNSVMSIFYFLGRRIQKIFGLN
tara:strand:+ start:434 stop:1453 length:1020 start_codon:yes stop_codon:yes gene_type:complete